MRGGAYGVIGIEDRSLEPSAAGVAEGPFWLDVFAGRGVSRSLRNCALFILSIIANLVLEKEGVGIGCWNRYAQECPGFFKIS